MPPEIIKRSSYDYKADIWSLGITIIELATGNPPFSDIDPRRALFLIPRSKPPKLDGDFSTSLKEFIALCLREEPEDRPSAADLLCCQFLKNVNSGKASAGLIKGLISRQSECNEGSGEELEDLPYDIFPIEYQSLIHNVLAPKKTNGNSILSDHEHRDNLLLEIHRYTM
jgi:serine/threonine protein kinase